MMTKTDRRKRALSLMLVALFTTSLMTAFAAPAGASMARTYTAGRDPQDIAIGDLDGDGHNDLAIATDGSHTISILWNDGNGNFWDRTDVWVTGNTSRNADWDEFSNVQFIEVGEFNGDSDLDIAIYQRNNPFKQDDAGNPASEPGNLTIIENNGARSFSIGERYTHFYAWDIEVGDFDDDGNDDVAILGLYPDITTQYLQVYKGPVTCAETVPSSTASAGNCGEKTELGPASTYSYREFEVGDYGETEQQALSTCVDDDIFLLRSEGVDYATGNTVSPGNSDNVTILEYGCSANPVDRFPTALPTTATIIQMNTVFGGLDIADLDDDGTTDVIAMTDGNVRNITYSVSTSQGNWGAPQIAYFGPYISYDLTVADLNGDGHPDFVNPTVAFQQDSTDSAGGTTSAFYLNYPSTVQVTLSSGANQHTNPLSYESGRRPNMAAVGQLAGDAQSAPDIAVGHTSYNFGNWVDNFGWEGQYDTITVVEMDNKDLAVTGLSVDPVDRWFGVAGEGSRQINVTVTNTGMDTLNTGSATVDVELKIVDEAASSNTTVYANDWDSPEDASGCGTGCTWAYEEYVDGYTHWHLQTNSSVGATGNPNGNNGANISSNYLNQGNFMWAGEAVTNSSGDLWTGYGKNWDDAMVLENVDLTSSDRAFMSVELFKHLGYGALGSADTNGFVVNDVWDDLAIVEVGSDETGWSTIGCPSEALFTGACGSGDSFWGGFDNERLFKQLNGGAAESRFYYGSYFFSTYYGWQNFTADDLGEFDLSPWAGETVDIRFRFSTGFEGSTADDDEQRWQGYDGFAVDNLTIYKQNTAFLPNPQQSQATIDLAANPLAPGEEYTTSITANLVNDTTYRVSAVLSNNAWDEQELNDELVGYLTPFNVYDPAVEGIENFRAGALYAEDTFDIVITTNNWGNTEVDFDVKASVFSALPSDVYCGTPSQVCEESFETTSQGYRFSHDGNPNGAIYTEATCNEAIFGEAAYWFGHPCDTATDGYGEEWNETMTIPDVDMTSMTGDFVALNFEYYADTFFTTDSQGNNDPSDTASIEFRYNKDGTDFKANLLGQWNDYDEDGTCGTDVNGDGFINGTEAQVINYDEIKFTGDAARNDGTGGNYNVFFNSDDLVSSRSIDLTHLIVTNTTSGINLGQRECISLAGSTVQIDFVFRSDDDGRNGINDGFKGIAFNNISLQEFTFTLDNEYTVSRTGVDAEDVAQTLVASHDFTAGVYMIQAETIFDNTTQGTAWFGADEVETSNNQARVIFNVESVDISLSKPSTLACLDDQVLACVLPTDSAVTHDWSLSAINGVLTGEYVFTMNVEDITDPANPTMAHTTTYGTTSNPITLEPQERTDLTFAGWTGYQDGRTYNISYSATIAATGESSGNVRYFHATFADLVDVAILSESTTRTSTIKQDLALLGMSYTQYEIDDWNDYLTTTWILKYNKVVLPWQTAFAAKDIGAGGLGYYEKLGDNKDTLENFMDAGGTIQAHMAPHGDQVYAIGTTDPRLPLDLNIQSRATDTTKIRYADLDIADPFHPILDNVDSTNFQGFDADTTVATAVVSTIQADADTVPARCGPGGGGFMEAGGSFQSLLRTQEETVQLTETILGVCSYGSSAKGGMIVTTMDVATVSARADSTTFPLLGNMLAYDVTAYPNGFGTRGNGLDLTINGDVPETDPSTNDYKLRYMKSDAELTFGFTTATTEPLTADWIMDGPTAWDGSAMASGVSYSTDTNPTATFCQADISEVTGCRTGAEWTVTLMLHDDEGHARTIQVVLQTNDLEADEDNPNASAIVVTEDRDYAEQLELTGTKVIPNVEGEWEQYRLTLDENGETSIDFDAGASFDPDALSGTGITEYEWTVYNDEPYGEFRSPKGVYTENAASQGEWTYTFRNVTIDAFGEQQAEIRIELIVTDGADKSSQKFRFYFVVVPAGFGDEEPVVTLDWGRENGSRVVEDTLSVSGSVVTGAEDETDVFVELAFEEETFGLTPIQKFNAETDGTFAKTKEGLGDGDSFVLNLSLDGMYSNVSQTQRIFIKIYEYDSISGERWVTIKWLEINLAPCQGLEADPDAEAAGGRFVLVDGACEWEGVWTYDPVTGEWSPPVDTSGDGDGSSGLNVTMIAGIGGALLVIVLLTLVFLRRGGDDDGVKNVDFSMGMVEQDPVEQYVQQLVAQGYPEETARAHAQQYAGQLGGAAAATQAAAPAGAGLYEQYYQQYLTQLTQQGYDQATAQQYAAQYAQAAVQQQQ
ncbi:MAG: VCBS repeat-containing protein [Candidatus Thermoplasmatota archaeon]|nr:VCBS repeat-containing protein [Candidatus Thermoplasmatota archaeon]